MTNSKKRRIGNTRRRNKKQNGGVFGASSSASNPKTRAEKLQMLLGNSRDSGMLQLLTDRLFQLPPGMPPPSRHVKDTMDNNPLASRVKMKRVENEVTKLFKKAESLHATSFKTRNLPECFAANVEAVRVLNEAIDMGTFDAGSLQARALLADILLNGNTAGVAKDVREATRLASLGSQADDPDCKGVLAHSYLIDGIPSGRMLADESAAAGSKYGQYVVGLYELQKNDRTEAVKYFTLAAAQNYDEAQIALSQMQSDTDEALRLMLLAADQGNAYALYSIALLYIRKSNRSALRHYYIDAAIKWSKLAVDANRPYAVELYLWLNRQRYGY